MVSRLVTLTWHLILGKFSLILVLYSTIGTSAQLLRVSKYRRPKIVSIFIFQVFHAIENGLQGVVFAGIRTFIILGTLP